MKHMVHAGAIMQLSSSSIEVATQEMLSKLHPVLLMVLFLQLWPRLCGARAKQRSSHIAYKVLA